MLIALVTRMKRLEIGGLGACDILPDHYAYVGNAFGAGGHTNLRPQGARAEAQSSRVQDKIVTFLISPLFFCLNMSSA